MKKSLKVLGILVCVAFVAGSGAMAQVGVFQNAVTLDAAEYTNVATPGSVTEANGVYTIKGNGRDIWDNGDEGFFAYTELSGSRSIQAKVKWIDAKGDAAGGSDWAKIGVMVREKGNLPESKHYWIEMRGGAGDPALGDRTDVQWRPVEAQASSNVEIKQADGAAVAAADGVWLRVSRNAATNDLTASYSMDGVTWVVAHTLNIPMQETVSYGIIITSHTSDTQVFTAEVSDVSLGAGVFPNAVTLDAAEYTNVATKGSVTEANGVYTLKGNGRDIWDNGDEAFFIYKNLSGPNSISAKVKWIASKGDAAGGSDWSKIGVMIREKGNLPESKHYWIDFRGGAGDPALGDRTDVQWRPVEGQASSNVEVKQADGSAVASADGVWYRVSRYPDDLFVAEYSLDGLKWTFAHSLTLPMAETAAYGLIITSHTSDTQIVTAEASNVKFGAPIGSTSSSENWELFK